MNLVKSLKIEIDYLKIDNQYEIARYIYIRLGELFNYDPLYIFGNGYEKEFIKNKRINVYNVDDYDLTCMSWSYMYVELLKVFGIKAEVIKNDIHAAVVLVIDNKKFLADLTNANEDITNIKFGLPIKNFQQINSDKEDIFNFDKIDEKVYLKDEKKEKLLENLKQKLEFMKQNQVLENYDYLIFKLIEKIINETNNIGFVSGVTFINRILDELDCKIVKHHYLNKELKEFLEVYCLIKNLKKYYFIYQKSNDGMYELYEQKEEDVKVLSKKYLINSSVDFKHNNFNLKYN